MRKASTTVLGVLLLLSALPARAATLTVNNGGDGVSPGDGLTLREAILLARGDMRTCVGTAETRQVSSDVYWLPAGPPCVGAWNVDLIRSNLGGSASDRIVFDPSRVTTVAPTTQLPWIFDNDSVNGDLGNGLRLLLEGAVSGGAFGLPIRWVGIDQSYAGGTFSNLHIARFRDGIHASGVTKIKISNVEVHDSIGTGIKITFLTLPDGSLRSSAGVVIGGSAASDRVFSYSNADDGIVLEGSPGRSTTNHLVGPVSVGFRPGNSTQALGNGRYGLVLQYASSSVIGRDGASMASFFVGNGVDGIVLRNDSDANDLFNNVIGTDPSGMIRLGNGSSGIAVLSGSSKNRIGGGWSLAESAGNVVAANRFGIFLADPGTDDNTLTGNFVGTDRDFHGGLANGDVAVTLYNGVRRNRVGIGPWLANGNWLMGSVIGVDMRDASTTENTVRGNSIGAVDATRAMPNYTGVMLRVGAHGNTVMENMIARNLSNAIWLVDEGSSGNVISDNLIGTNTAGSRMGNGGDGVLLGQGARDNRLSGNTIRFNGGSGVGLDRYTSGNQVQLGVTCNNGGLALDLSLDGVGCSGGDSGGNMCSVPPVVTGADGTSVTGTSAPYALIDVYETVGLTCVSRRLGSTFADQTGSWTLPNVVGCPEQPSGRELRATQTPRLPPLRGTSELSYSPFLCP